MFVNLTDLGQGCPTGSRINLLSTAHECTKGTPETSTRPGFSSQWHAMFSVWTWGILAIAASFHTLAILSTVFRLWYRWYTARMWWDDAWSAVALLADIACLIGVLLEQPVPDSIPRFLDVANWIVTFAFPTIMWVTRISILASMVRVSQPQGKLKRVARGIGIAFGVMWIGMMAQRLQLCIVDICGVSNSITIAQTAADSIADVLLTTLPIVFLRGLKLSRKRKILISSAFSASIVINILTVAQAIVLFQPITSGSIIVGHVKNAFSLIVCNLLVIVTFIYRILHKGETALDESVDNTSRVEFTTIDLSQAISPVTSKALSPSIPPTTTKSSQVSSTWSFRAPGGRSISSTVTAASKAQVTRNHDDVLLEET